MSGYLGNQPVPQATQTRDAFTATAGQTSFATRGYTPNFLDVFLNGVKLAAADYTATNGSDVVLASGAATGDILEVVAFTTFNSASSSIDDNGNATAITIDSNENVLIGTASVNAYGASFSGNNYLYLNRDGGNALFVDRGTSDGSLIELRKAGSTVGYVGTYGGDLTVGTGDTGVRFIDSLDCIVPISDAAGTSRDAAVDLGYSSIRYKDAYLSGGIYLGGAVAANKLDDYEEGTFTPTNTGTVGVAVSNGKYTKVGEVVHFHIFFQWTSNTSMTKEFSGLPFTVKGASSPENTYFTMCSTWNNQGVTYPSGRTTLLAYPLTNTTNVEFSCIGSNIASASPTFASSGQLYITGHYYTAS